MILFLHILIALSSIVYTGYMYLFPSKRKLSISYGFVALTIISGTYLMIIKPAHMMQTCIVGLIYLGVVLSGIIAARNKLVRATV